MTTDNAENSNSEEYIIRLLQTIESLDSTMKSMSVEIQFLRDELARLREKDAEHDMERKRLMKLLEAKDEDLKKMTDKMTDLLGKVDVLTKALEDKTHQLTNRHRSQFGTKTNNKLPRRGSDYVETPGFIPGDFKLKNIKETKVIGFR